MLGDPVAVDGLGEVGVGLVVERPVQLVRGDRRGAVLPPAWPGIDRRPARDRVAKAGRLFLEDLVVGLDAEQRGQEILRRRVLVEPPHQIGDRGGKVVGLDDGRVHQQRARPSLHRGGMGRRHALQHLELETVGPAAAGELVALQQAPRDVEQVVTGETDAHGIVVAFA